MTSQHMTRIPMSFCGRWQRDEVYQIGDCVQHKNTVWIFRGHGDAPEPGASASWQMLVKSVIKRDRCPATAGETSRRCPE